MRTITESSLEIKFRAVNSNTGLGAGTGSDPGMKTDYIVNLCLFTLQRRMKEVKAVMIVGRRAYLLSTAQPKV